MVFTTVAVVSDCSTMVSVVVVTVERTVLTTVGVTCWPKHVAVSMLVLSWRAKTSLAAAIARFWRLFRRPLLGGGMQLSVVVV
jgi:hypothetical protein